MPEEGLGIKPTKGRAGPGDRKRTDYDVAVGRDPQDLSRVRRGRDPRFALLRFETMS